MPVDLGPAPEDDRDVAQRSALGLAFQRNKKIVFSVPRTRPLWGAGPPAPDQMSSIRSTVRTSCNPPSSGNAPPPGIQTCTADPSRSILRTSALSPSLSPESDALPAAATSG